MYQIIGNFGKNTCKSKSLADINPEQDRPDADFSNTEDSKVFKYKCTYSATVCDVMKRRGWVEVEDNQDDWDIFFCDMNQFRDIFSSSSRQLNDGQRLAHFRNCFEISRKNLMVKNLKRLRYRIEKIFGVAEAEKCNFYPTTFVLPSEQPLFLNEFRINPGSLWIIKPAAGAQGRGIFIFQKLKDYFDWRGRSELNENPSQSQVPGSVQGQQQQTKSETRDKQAESDQSNDDVFPVVPKLPTIDISPVGSSSQDDLPLIQLDIPTTSTGTCSTSNSVDPHKNEHSKHEIYVVQRYIMNPYLIGGKKFDIRFYVLVTSHIPLKAWVYREGFARFSGGQFSLKSLEDMFVHLTNIAVQKTAEDYNAEKGSKWSLRDLREYLTSCHGRERIEDLMNQIDNIVIRTLQSVHRQIIQDKHCFEIYGFDVLIDDTVRPWLLEVNASPAFTPSNEDDYRLKCNLIDDTIHVLDLEKRLTGFEKRVGGFDLIWNDGPVYANREDCCHANGSDNGAKLNSYLGCTNDRQIQLREILGNAKFIREMQNLHIGPIDSEPIGDISIEKKSSGALIKGSNSLNGNIKDDRFRYPGEPVHPHSLGINYYNYLLSNSSGGTTKRASKTKLHSTHAKSDTGFVITGKPVQIKKNMIDYIKYLDKNKY